MSAGNRREGGGGWGWGAVGSNIDWDGGLGGKPKIQRRRRSKRSQRKNLESGKFLGAEPTGGAGVTVFQLLKKT